jgi:hypothetical protein
MFKQMMFKQKKCSNIKNGQIGKKNKVKNVQTYKIFKF